MGNDLAVILSQSLPDLRRIAPKFVNVERMVNLAIEAKMHNPLLEKCSPVSVLNFCKKCAETGTDRVGAGGMWAVPFWSKKNNCYEMTPIPDWRLLVEKAKKAKAIKHAIAEAVYANDEFRYERGLEPVLIHRPALKDRGEIVAVYCVYVLPDDTKDFVVMDWAAEIIPIRDRTNAWKSYKKDGHENPWVTDPAEQGKKTVIKRAMKLFEGASIELTALLDADNVVNGFTAEDLTPRAPVAMPRELPPTGEKPPESTPENKPETPPTEKPGQPADTAPTASTVTGPVEEIKEKSGKTGNKTWTHYGIKVNGKLYGTFDTAIHAEAVQAKETGQQVTIEHITNDKGFLEIKSLVIFQGREPGQEG